jgi:hypothetical protein
MSGPVPRSINQLLSAAQVNDDDLLILRQFDSLSGGFMDKKCTAAQLRAGVTTDLWLPASSDLIMSPNVFYYVLGPGLINLTLPSIATAGTRQRVAGYTGTGWKILQGAGQQIIYGNVSTTSGVTGQLESTLITDSIELLCVQDNTIWIVPNGPQGNINFV